MSTILGPLQVPADPNTDLSLRFPTVNGGQRTAITGSHDAQTFRFQQANDLMRQGEPRELLRELEAVLAYVAANDPERLPQIRALLEDVRKRFQDELVPQLTNVANQGERVALSIRNRTGSTEEITAYQTRHAGLNGRLDIFRAEMRQAVDGILGGTPNAIALIRLSIDALLGTVREGIESAARILLESVTRGTEQEEAVPRRVVLPNLREELLAVEHRERIEDRREREVIRQPSIHETKTILDSPPRFEAEFLQRRGVFDTPILTPPLFREDDEVLRKREEVSRRLEARGKHITRDLQGHLSEVDQLADLEAELLCDDDRAERIDEHKRRRKV